MTGTPSCATLTCTGLLQSGKVSIRRCTTASDGCACHGIGFGCRVLGSHCEWPAEMWQLVVFIIEVQGYELYILQGRAATKLGLLVVHQVWMATMAIH